MGVNSAPTSYIVPLANDPKYIPTLLEICKKEKISLLFPGMDCELSILSKNKKKFEELGTKVIVSSAEVIKISDNKQALYDRLTPLGIKVPCTTSISNFSSQKTLPFPVIIKQKVGGARSKNVFVVNNQEEFTDLMKDIKGDNFIAQEYIEGDEYTCGTVCLDEEYIGSIIMKRILRNGDTYKCFSLRSSIIENTLKKVINTIKPFGACNIQLKLKNNIPYIFEINARCSGTTAARTICGFNEPKMIADFLLKNKDPRFEVKELTILRYWNELVIDNKDINNLKNHKRLKTKQKFL